MIVRKIRALAVTLLIPAVFAGLMGCDNAEEETKMISEEITETADAAVTTGTTLSVTEVNGMIDSLVLSEEYKNSDFQQRKEAAQKLLDDMVEKGIIKQYSYDEEKKLFSFQHSNGALGGISLKDHSYDTGIFPMN